MSEFDRKWRPARREPDSSDLARRAEELRAGLRGRPAAGLASATGSDLVAGGFRLHLFTQPVFVPFPDLTPADAETGLPLPLPAQALLLYYFANADGALLTGRWISFAELPDGRIYNQAYQGYTGDLLARRFGADLPAFERAARSLGGREVAYGDRGFAFQALPRVSLLAVLWQGEDEFPASAKVLFDASVVHALPTDVCAILGGMLTRRLLSS